MSDISEKVQKALDRINSKDLSKQELINSFNNINENTEITDIEREELISVVEKKMRIKFPNAAKKMLGSKSKKAQELLQEIFEELKNDFDWSKNKVKSHVKVCGSMISGKEYVCWYISYKNDEGYSTGLSYHQITSEDDPFLEVDYRRVGKDYEKDREVKKFPVQLKDEAVTLFKTHLSKTILSDV